MDIFGQSGKGIAKEGDVEANNVQNESIELIPDRIEKMSVQELRSELRRIGVSAKGRKADLVSALKSFLESSANDEGDLVKNGNQSSEQKPNTPEKKSSKRNTQVVTAMKVSTLHCLETGMKVVQAEDSIKEEETTVVSRKQKHSLKTTETAGKKASGSKRKKTQEISPTVVEASLDATPSISQSEPWTIFAHKKPQKGWKAYNPRTMRPLPLTGNTKSMKLLSWNVNGLRALLKLKSFSALQLAERENFDVLCLQETKLQEKDVDVIKQTLLAEYDNSFWTCSSSKLGYSGTAVISRIKPVSVRYGLGISDHDNEGRLVTVEFDSFYLLCAYVPNSGDGLRRLSYRVTQWDPSLGSYLKELEKSKPVILTGDLNCAHEEIDIYNPDGNRRSAGFTIEERNSFETNFLNQGFVDTFREQHPGVVGYTYWGYRHGGRKTNRGWRLDYFLISQSIANNVHDSYILPDVTGSDHSPIGLILKI